MKRPILLVGIFFLLTAGISSAQAKLVRTSHILPSSSRRVMNLFSIRFTENTRTHDTLIVWYEHDLNTTEPNFVGPNSRIVGRIVDANGKAQKAFTIVSKPQNSDDSWDEYYLCTAYNPITNGYLLLFSEGHPETDRDEFKILSLPLTSAGRPLGRAIDITSANPRTQPFTNRPLLLKFNPFNDGYSLFFAMHGAFSVPGDSFAFYQLLDAKGKPSAPPIMLEEGAGGENLPLVREGANPSDFFFLPSGKLLMQAIRSIGNTSYWAYRDYVVTAVDPSNPDELRNLRPQDWKLIARVDNPDPSNRKDFMPVMGSSLAFPSSEFAIYHFTDNTNAKGRKINVNGKPAGASFSAVNPPMNKKRLIISDAAFLATSKEVVGILITYEDVASGTPTSIWAQVLDRNGKPVGSPGKLYSTGSTEKIWLGKIAALPTSSEDNFAHFVWYGIPDDVESYDVVRSLLRLDISLPLP